MIRVSSRGVTKTYQADLAVDGRNTPVGLSVLTTKHPPAAGFALAADLT
jgi:hypothetical protein